MHIIFTKYWNAGDQIRRFSQRKGIKPVKDVIQKESMDDDLRNGLWNALDIYYWRRVLVDSVGNISKKDISGILFSKMWIDFFKLPIDTMDSYWSELHDYLRKYYFESKWYEVYDFIEFVANIYPSKTLNSDFMEYSNSIMKRELSAYRFVEGRIVEITSEEEITEIEEALRIFDPLSPVTKHLQTALGLLADRKSPDYRNSIKESISAVEAICKLITGNTKATLGGCLNEIGKKIELQPALREAFSRLYGYTSSSDGIRHALIEQTDLDFEDAKFMLVSCSAFVNYLKTKASKAKIEIFANKR